MVFPELVKEYAKKIISEGQEVECWQFCTLSNDGFFYQPINIKSFNSNCSKFAVVTIPFGNDFIVVLDAESIGIVATIYALDNLVFHHPQLQLIDTINSLLDYAKTLRFNKQIEQAVQ